MSRRAEGQLFVGRLSKSTRVRDLEDLFEPYGRMLRCDVKYGAEMAYAFIDFEDRRDGEDAVKYENGRELCGSSIIVEWAKGNPRRPLVRQPFNWEVEKPVRRADNVSSPALNSAVGGNLRLNKGTLDMMNATAATVQDTGPEIVQMTGPLDLGGRVEAVDTDHLLQGGEGGATDPDLDPDLEEVAVEIGGRGVEVAVEAEAVIDAVNAVATAAEVEVVAGTRRGEHHGVVLEAGLKKNQSASQKVALNPEVVQKVNQWNKRMVSKKFVVAQMLLELHLLQEAKKKGVVLQVLLMIEYPKVCALHCPNPSAVRGTDIFKGSRHFLQVMTVF